MAVYTSQLLQGTITWQNYNGTVLQTKTYLASEGEPSYSGSTPSRSDYIPSSGTGTRYTFSGWTLISSSGLDKTYRASFSSRTLYIWDRYDMTTGNFHIEYSGGDDRVIEIGEGSSGGYYDYEEDDTIVWDEVSNKFVFNLTERFVFTQAQASRLMHSYYSPYSNGNRPTSGVYTFYKYENQGVYARYYIDKSNCTVYTDSAPSKGSKNGYVTSTSSNAYPNDGQSGNYWYIKR